MKVLYNWEGAIYSDKPTRKRARILTQSELQALQARGYTLLIERYD